MRCPKCGYERLQTDSAPDWQCPSCKVAYIKVLEAPAAAPDPLPATRDHAELDDDGSSEREWLVSSGQKIVIYSILINIILHSAEQGRVIAGWFAFVLYFCAAGYSLLGIVRICSGLQKSQGVKLVFMALSYMPLINLVALVYLSVRATRMLREAGWTVGLLGARQ